MARTIGIIGHGIVGQRAAQVLTTLGVDTRVTHARNATQLNNCDAVIVASGAPHSLLVSALVSQSTPVVSVSDSLSDVLSMVDLSPSATNHDVPVVVGAACAPGMSGLLVRHMSRAFDSIDEVHTAVHGTGGPLCARQHHDALAGLSVGWHDGEWLQRPAGSGRELCWFPDPVGARDCYRFASADPVLMQRASPELSRITARVSATRRDRLTARLPMLRKPHDEGLEGALRVEVRGVRRGRRHVEIVGVVEPVGTVAAAVAAHTALAIAQGDIAPGVHCLGESTLPNADLLQVITESGIELHQFVGF